MLCYKYRVQSVNPHNFRMLGRYAHWAATSGMPSDYWRWGHSRRQDYLRSRDRHRKGSTSNYVESRSFASINRAKDEHIEFSVTTSMRSLPLTVRQGQTGSITELDWVPNSEPTRTQTPLGRIGETFNELRVKQIKLVGEVSPSTPTGELTDGIPFSFSIGRYTGGAAANRSQNDTASLQFAGTKLMNGSVTSNNISLTK